MKNHCLRPHSSLALLATSLLLGGTSLRAQALLAALPSESGARSTATVNAAFSGKAKLKSGHTRFGEVSSQDVTANFSEMVSFSSQDDLGFGFDYGRTSFDFAGNAATSPVPERLQHVALDVTYAHRFNEDWSATLGVSPGYHSANSLFSSDSFGTTAAAVGRYRVNSTLSFAAGVGFDSLAAGAKFRGALSADWQPSTQWRVQFGYPKTAVTYAISESFELSALLTGNFHSYRVEKDPQPGMAGKPSLENSKLDYSDTRVGIAATYKLSPRFIVTGAVGSIVDRQFDYHQRNFKVRSDDIAAYGSLGLTARF